MLTERIDLKDALRLEPPNDSVKQELKKVQNLLLQAKSKQSAVSISFTSYIILIDVDCT
jgi:hypothetical protein